MDFGWVPAPVPRQLWRDCDTLLARAADHAGEDMADVERDIASERAQLWVARDGRGVRAALVTQSCGDTLHLWMCGGTGLREWVGFMDRLKATARHAGFRRLTLDGRKGWLKVLGWTELELE